MRGCTAKVTLILRTRTRHGSCFGNASRHWRPITASSSSGRRRVPRFGPNWAFVRRPGKLSELPPEWQAARGEWFVLQLKDEEAITQALDKDFAAFMSAEKRNTERTHEQARTLRNIITIIGFAIGILCLGFAAYLLVHRNTFSPGP